MKDYDTYKFIELLKVEGIKYHYEDKWLIIGEEYGVDINMYSSSNYIRLPNYIKFNNNGYVNFQRCDINYLPNNIIFNNKGGVSLSENNIKHIPEGIKFGNDVKTIWFYGNPLESLPDNIDQFYDRLDFYIKEYINKKFPDHWVINKERFNL